MTESFETARTTILDVDSAWAKLEPALASASHDADTLEKAAQALGMETIRASPLYLPARPRICVLVESPREHGIYKC